MVLGGISGPSGETCVHGPEVAQVDGDPLFDGPVQDLSVEVLPSYYSLRVAKPS